MMRLFARGWLVLTFFVAACHFGDRPALRIGSNVWPCYEPLYVAQDAGLLDAKQVKVLRFTSAVEVMRAYRNGVLDAAALTADEALSVAASEPGVHKIFLVTDFSKGADAVLVQPQFHSVGDLRNRRVGAEGYAIGAYVLARTLDHAGMQVSDIEFVPLALDEHESAFRAARIDAVVTFEPHRTRLLASGAVEVFSTAQIQGEVFDVLIARKALLDARPDAIRELVAAWLAGARLVPALRPELQLRASERNGLSPEQYRGMFARVELLDHTRNARLFDQRELEPKLAPLAQAMTSRSLLQPSPTSAALAELIENRFVASTQ